MGLQRPIFGLDGFTQHRGLSRTESSLSCGAYHLNNNSMAKIKDELKEDKKYMSPLARYNAIKKWSARKWKLQPKKNENRS